LLIISVLSFGQVEFFLFFFIYKEKMPRKYFWTIFIVGGIIVIQCICTSIVALNTPTPIANT
jgi:heme/copper-type cytochrome/quinol oxidase subunit 4